MSILDLIAKEGPVQGYMEAVKFQEESEGRKIANLYNTTVTEKAQYDLERAKTKDRTAAEIANEVDAEKKRKLQQMFVTQFPDEAKKQAEAISKMTDTQLLQEKAKNEREDALLRGVEAAPENMKEQVYQSALVRGKEMGADVSTLPKTYQEFKQSGLGNVINAASINRKQLIELQIAKQKANASTVTANAAAQNARTQEAYRQFQEEQSKEEQARKAAAFITDSKGGHTDVELRKLMEVSPYTPKSPPELETSKIRRTINDSLTDFNTKFPGLTLDTEKGSVAKNLSTQIYNTQSAAYKFTSDPVFTSNATKADLLSRAVLNPNGKGMTIGSATKPDPSNPAFMNEFGIAAYTRNVNGKPETVVVYQDYLNVKDAAQRLNVTKRMSPELAPYSAPISTLQLDMSNPSHVKILDGLKKSGKLYTDPVKGEAALAPYYKATTVYKSIKTGTKQATPEERKRAYNEQRKPRGLPEIP